MAYERKSDSKIRGDSLDVFVSGLTKTLSNQVAIRNTEDETNFNKLVLENNMSLPDQLDYRKDQLKRVSDDPGEKARIKGEISNLKDRIEQKSFSDAYTQHLIDFSSGAESVDGVISWLKSQRSTQTDQTILNSIDKELITQEGNKFELTRQLMKNATDYALTDKTDTVLATRIGEVQAARGKALLAGDATTVSMYDLQIQALTKALSEGSITKTIQNFATSTYTGSSDPVKLLDSYNNQINSANASGPVTIGDTTYPSSKDFWTFKRDSYVADQSNSGLIPRLQSNVDDAIKVAASKNLLTADMLKKLTSPISNLIGRPEMAGYEAKLTTSSQAELQAGADLLSDKILSAYQVNYDITKAVTELTGLKALGVNVDKAYTTILQTAAQIKTGQVSNILAAAQNAMQNDPNLTPEQAIQAAVAGGASIVQSPTDLANKSETQIATEASKTATTNAGTDNPLTTIQKPAPEPTATSPIIAAKSITVKNGETLSQIAARELGDASRFKEIAAANGISDPNKIQAGATLIIPGSTPAPSATPAPTPTASPSPQPSPTVTPAPTPTAPVAPVVTPAPTTPTVAPTQQKSTYDGSSIVDYLGTIGKDASFASRTELAKQNGINNYTGTADQNLQLLKTLRGS
jgi:hypothetical protein